MLCVAELATQIAATEAHKHRRGSAVKPSSLQGVENLIDFISVHQSIALCYN